MRAKNIPRSWNRMTVSGLREAIVLLHVPSITLVSGLLGLLLDPNCDAPVNWSKFSERPQRQLATGAHVLWGEAEDTRILQPEEALEHLIVSLQYKTRLLKRWNQAFNHGAWQGENDVNWHQGIYRYLLRYKGKKTHHYKHSQHWNTYPKIQ